MRTIFPCLFGLVLFIYGNHAAADERLFQDATTFDEDFPPLMVEVLIPSHGQMLTGTWYMASGDGPHPTIVTLHAFPGYEKNLDLAQALRRVGFNVLYFDYRGVWGGPGEFSVSSGYEDAASAIAFATNPANAKNLRIDRSRLSLLGHSFGAVAALDVGADHRAVRCVISLAPEDMTLMIGTADARQGLARYTDNLRVVAGYSGQDLIDDLLAHRDEWAMTTTVRSLGDKPYLIVAGELDNNFDGSNLEDVVRAGKEAGASAITADLITDADHSFSAKRIELTLKVAEWLQENCR